MPRQIKTLQVMTNLELDDPAPATTIAGNWTEAEGYGIATFHFYWSGGAAPVGTLEIQASNDDAKTAPVTLLPVADLTGNSGNGVIELLSNGYKHLRPVYTYTSGSNALLNCFLNLSE